MKVSLWIRSCGRSSHGCTVPALLLLVGLFSQAPPTVASDDVSLRAALDAACSSDADPDAVLRALGSGIHLLSEDLNAPSGVVARRHRLMLTDGSRIRLDTHRRDGRLVQVILELGRRMNGVMKPRTWVVADGRCSVRSARRLVYGAGGSPGRLENLNNDLTTVRSTLRLDEPVPPGAVTQGVPVAMVDSGVNYSLPSIAGRLARDPQGALVGHDYWDEDPRPFDSHPSRSAFHPTRHGTRTASVVLDDAPVALIAPMRYPRPDMSRMRQLVADASRQGIVIVNLSLGGRVEEQWRAFADAARQHPHVLFIVSAGNNGRDLDEAPVYPAAFALDNLITVTSADSQGLPARGSNWGRRTVDLLVPAENLIATDFSGYATHVSGSSYAAARVSALAACFKAANPGWRAGELKGAIFALATRPVHESVSYVSVGLLPEPTLRERGACPAEAAEPVRLGRMELSSEAIGGDGPEVEITHELAPLTLVWVEDAGWSLESLRPSLARAAAIYAQCGIRFGEVSVDLWRLPRRQRYFDTSTALSLMKTLAVPAPSVWFMRDTLQQPAFDAEAFGRSNTRRRRSLMNSVWMTAHLEHPGIALAHELYHVLANTGGHVPEKDNLMHGETSATSTRLGDWQCDRLKKVGTAFDLIRPVGTGNAREDSVSRTSASQ